MPRFLLATRLNKKKINSIIYHQHVSKQIVKLSTKMLPRVHLEAHQGHIPLRNVLIVEQGVRPKKS